MATDGTFFRPADGSPIFPKRGIDLRWRYDKTKESIIVNFWEKNKPLNWRWDELKPKAEMTFPSTVPDFHAVGHVGKLTFTYELLSAAGVSAITMDSSPLEKLQTLLLNLAPVSIEGREFDYWGKGFEQEHCRSGYDGLGRVFAAPPVGATIGEGTFGVVWLAKNRKTGYLYAVKNMVSKLWNDDACSTIAHNEFDVVDKLVMQPHPCIVTFFALESFTIAQGELYMLVMEFCPGGDLQDALDKCVSACGKEYKPPPEALPWIGQIFLAMEHIHTKLNLLIRDLKPQNVLLDRRRCVKLADFGCGRLVAESSGGDWTFCFPPGSPGYVAPEVLAQESYSYPVDIYSFGVVVWVILSGGCRMRRSPAPPTYGSGNGGFSQCSTDWQLLEEYFKNPNDARYPVDALAMEVLSTMVQVDSCARPDCEAIRSSAFFHDSILPRLGGTCIPQDSYVEVNGQKSDMARFAKLSNAERLKEEGNALFKQGAFERALDVYAKALKACKDHSGEVAVTIHNNRAGCYQQLSDFDAVVEETNIVLAQEPENIKALVRRMRALEPLEKYNEALADARKVLEKEAGNEAANQMQHRLSKAVRDDQREGLGKAVHDDLVDCAEAISQ